MSNTPSIDYINYICSLYNDVYDDRIEDNRLFPLYSGLFGGSNIH